MVTFQGTFANILVYDVGGRQWETGTAACWGTVSPEEIPAQGNRDQNAVVEDSDGNPKQSKEMGKEGMEDNPFTETISVIFINYLNLRSCGGGRCR